MSKGRTTEGGQKRHPNCPKYALDGKVDSCDEAIWQRIVQKYSDRNVFLNVSYVQSYRSRLHTLISLLLNLGLSPILASIEKREGASRLCKLCELIQSCKFAITDLSFAERHNIPFEAGLIFGLGRRNILLYGGPKFKGQTKTKILDDRISNLKELDEVVYYQKYDLSSLATSLLTRITSSPELLKLTQRLRCPANGSYAEFVKTLSQRILHNKVTVDNLYKETGNNYALTVDRLQEVVKARSVPTGGDTVAP